MLNRSTKKKSNGTRNRSRRNPGPPADALYQLLSILPSASLGSASALGGQRGAGKPARKPRPAERLGKPKKKQSSRAVVAAPLPPSVRFFLDHWHPFSQTIPLPFHTTNVEQTLATRGIRYSYEREISIPANSTTWIMLGCSEYLNVDATSQHIPFFTQNGVNYTMGPVNYSGPLVAKSCVGFMYQRLNAVNGPVTSNMGGNDTANDKLFAFNDDAQAWPITSVALTDAVRWCPLSYGIDLRRTGPVLNSAGDWFSITPASACLNPFVSLLRTTMNSYPSFKKHGSEHANVQIMARPHDMAYQHCTGVGNNTMPNPCIVLNLENGTSNALSFDLTVSVKYVVAGSASNKVLSTVDASPNHAHLLNATSAAVSAGNAPGHASTAVAEAVHSAVAAGKSAMEAASSVGQKLKDAGSWLKPFAGAAAGFSASA